MLSTILNDLHELIYETVKNSFTQPIRDSQDFKLNNAIPENILLIIILYLNN